MQEQEQQISLDEWERRTFERYGVPENLRRSILGQESANGTRLTSPTSVKGRYQVTQATAKQYGLDRDDIWQQPVAAAKHLRSLYDGIKQRNPGFSEKQAWLGTGAEYYFGGDAFDSNGNLSVKSRDGFSTPAKYATSIAERWSAFDRDGTPQPSAAPQSTPAPLSTAQRLGLKPAEGMDFDLSGGQSKPIPKSSPQPPSGQRKLLSAGPRVYPSPPKPSPFAPATTQQIAAGVDQRAAARAALIGPETNARLAKVEEFERLPLSTQIGERAYDALARGGAEVSRLGRRAAGAVVGLAASPITGRLEMAELRPESVRKWEDERQRELAERRLRYRPSLAGELGEEILEAAPVAAVAGLAGAATGGGALSALGTGGAISALGADWDDPRRALTQTALGAIAPVVGGKLGSAVAGRVAERLAGPAAQAATRVAGEIGGGAAGNVLQSGGEQLAFEGQISPRELTKAGIIGGALSVPGAMLPARPARAAEFRAALELTPTLRDVTPGQAQAPLGQGRASQEPTARPAGATAQDAITASGDQQAALRQALLTPELKAENTAQSEVEAFIAKAREAADRSGRPTEGRAWQAQEKQIRENVGQAQAAEERARLIERRLAELEQGPVAQPEPTTRPKPQFVADAEQRLSDTMSGRRAGSGAEQLLDTAIVVGWKTYRAGADFAAWSAEVIKEAGERVRPHLEKVWRDLSENFSVGPLPRTREDVERSPQFQRFFQDSKVADNQGNPLVVYHGTPGDVESFSKGAAREGDRFYFTESHEAASNYADVRSQEESGSPNVMPVYLAIRNPFDFAAPINNREAVRLVDMAAQEFGMSRREARDMLKDALEYGERGRTNEALFEALAAITGRKTGETGIKTRIAADKVLQKAGYDGIAEPSLELGANSRTWIAFKSEQIKSASGNRGDFDTSSGSILGGGFGSLQPLFEGRGKSSRPSPSPETPIEQMSATELRAELARTKQAAAGSRERLNKTVGKLERTSALDTISALRKTGLLSGAKTHLRNVGGNLAFQAAEEVSRIPSSIIDLAISSVSGRRTITGASLPATAKAGYEAATKGIREAGQILRRGMTNEDLKRLDLDREVRSGSRVIDAYVNGVFRLLGAEDRIFRTYAMRRSLESRAKAQAITESRYGKIKRGDIASRTQELVANPPEEMAAEALADAETATFNNENLVSRFLGAGRREIGKYPAGRVANFALDLFAPFKKTPVNIIARMIEYSPVSFGKNAVQVATAIAKRSFTPEQQRDFSETFGRGATGTALILLGYKLGLAGLMTGFADEDEAKRNRDVAAGRTPGAILNPLTNTWHQISAFTPLGSLLTIGATIAREQTRPMKDESKRFEKVAGAATKTVAEQPLLLGAKDISEALTRPGKVGERAGRIAGSFVPTIVNDVGELTDPTRREASGFTGQIQKRIPILRKSLPAATDVLGRPLEDRKTAFFDPTLTSSARDKTNPLERELVRLDVGLSEPRRKDGETAGQFAARRAKAGAQLTNYGLRMVSSSSYRAATRTEQAAMWEYLKRTITSQSDERRPNLELLDPDHIIEVIRESARRKRQAALSLSDVRGR